MVLRLYITVEYFLPIRNIFPRISLHDLPYNRIMKKYENSEYGSFSVPPAEIRDSNMAL